jgi:hypothetical protein
MAEEKAAYERRPGEPARAYTYAWEYFKLGSRRSLERLVQNATKTLPRLGSLKNLSAQWLWGERAAAYDLWIEHQNLEEAELSAREDAKIRQQRERERRESDYATSLKVREQVEAMLKYPLIDQQRVVERYPDGKEKVVQIFRAARWGKRDIVPLWHAASDLGGAAIRNEGAASTDTNINDVLKLVDYESAGKGGQKN